MVRVLDPKDLLVGERTARVQRVVARRTRSVVVVLEDLEDPHNVAAVLRTCESFGIQEVHAIARSYSFHANPKISQGSEKWLDLHLYREADRCLSLLKQRGYLLCATHLGEGAVSLLELPADRPLALVFGTEKVGVSDAALAACDLRFKIPMLGFSQSFNISVAAAICLSHLVLRRLAQRGEEEGDLPSAERVALERRFCELAVKQRHRLFPGLLNGPRGLASKKETEKP
jgi:tRNA (guanosine-2'-O-)-methyltransferase